MSLLLFFIGLWLGGIIGVFTLCLFQISGKGAEKEGYGSCLLCEEDIKSKCSKKSQKRGEL